MSTLLKKSLSTLLIVLSFSTMNASLASWECCEVPPCETSCGRTYVGAFGGGLYSNSANAYQMGTAFFTEAQGGPLAVNARGHLKKTSSGFGGVQIGYEWSNPNSCSRFAFATAFELEAFWYGPKNKGHLINTTAVNRLPEHDFADSFKSTRGVYLANVIFSFNNCSFRGFTPYVGGGIGATRISLKSAKSFQVAPPEPGVNHFNSTTHDSSWAFAAQAKAGVRYNFCGKFHLFAEYRYLFVDSANFIFGSTDYPNHVATSPWNVKFNHAHYNAFAIGFQYDL